jgi:hypothetical protein
MGAGLHRSHPDHRVAVGSWIRAYSGNQSVPRSTFNTDQANYQSPKLGRGRARGVADQKATRGRHLVVSIADHAHRDWPGKRRKSMACRMGFQEDVRVRECLLDCKERSAKQRLGCFVCTPGMCGERFVGIGGSREDGLPSLNLSSELKSVVLQHAHAYVAFAQLLEYLPRPCLSRLCIKQFPL